MADGKVTIETEIDNSGIKKDAKQTESKLSKIGSKSKGLENVTKAVVGMGGAFSTATKTFKVAKAEIEKLSEAYNVQAKAEKQLEAAAKNNPYLNSQSVQNLKNFASEMQNVSNVGDEVLLPLMSELAINGRTEAEIQGIIKASLDASASGTISLESAVQSLNMSYSGQIGQMGRVLPVLKDLTKEQLENGEAVKLVQEAYKGQAEATKDARQQMLNSKGDYEEALGLLTKPTSDMWNNFWKGWYEKGIEQINKLESFLDKNIIGRQSVNAVLGGASEGNLEGGGRRLYFYANAKNFNSEQLDSSISYLEGLKNRNEAEEEFLEVLKNKKEEIAELNKLTESQAKKEKELQEKEQTRKKALQDSTDNYNKIIEKRDNELSKLRETAKILGTEVDIYDELNIEMSAYFEMASDPLLTTRTEEQKKKVEELAEAWKKVNAEKGKSDPQDNESESRTKQIVNYYDTVAKYTTDIADMMGNLSDLVSKNIDSQTSYELASLEKQYHEGIISAEEFEDKKEELSRKSAEAKYKAQMFEWTANLLSIGSNTASGIARAWAENPYYVALPITGIIGTSGTIQLASAMANRPKPPQFANGGIVGGSSYSGDRITANVNSGEMILNARQQMELWRTANGRNGNNGMNVSIRNYRGNDTSVTPQITANGLEIVVKEIVKDGINNGEFNKALISASNKMNGIRYES